MCPNRRKLRILSVTEEILNGRIHFLCSERETSHFKHSSIYWKNLIRFASYVHVLKIWSNTWNIYNPSLHKKWNFPLRISLVNVIKSAVFYGFGHIYSRNPSRKTSFFVQCFFTIFTARSLGLKISRTFSAATLCVASVAPSGNLLSIITSASLSLNCASSVR